MNVTVNVTNTGNRAGDEIVQRYVHPKFNSVTQAVKALRDFAWISLAPGETKPLSFRIDAFKLAIYTRQMKYTVETGSFEIMVGASSKDTQTVLLYILR